MRGYNYAPDCGTHNHSSHNCPQNAGQSASSCCCCGVGQLPQLLSLSLSGDKSFEARNRRRTLIICKNAKCGPKLLKFNLFLTSTYKFAHWFFFFHFSCLQHLGAFLVACSTLQSFAVQQIKKLVSLITRGNFAFCIIVPPFPSFPIPLAVLSWQFAVLSFAFSFPFVLSFSTSSSLSLFAAYQLSVFELKMPADKFVNH